MTPLSAATFRVDVTPPLGESVCCRGIFSKVEKIEHPLEARGVIFDFEEGQVVIVAIDFCGISNASYALIRREIAEQVGIQASRVILHSVHQHTAPVLDLSAARMLYPQDDERLLLHLRFTEEIAGRIASAAKQALSRLRPVTKISAAKTQVEKVASNRRVRKPDGTIAVRYSAMKDPFYHEALEGLIDPWLRTVTFYEADTAFLQMHYYATHPQSFYADRNRVSYDVPGIARERLEQESGIFQIYFTGCAGNIAMGKYNAGTSADRAVLADRLYAAMRKTISSSSPAQMSIDLNAPSIEIDCAVHPLSFGDRSDGEFDPSLCETRITGGGMISEQRIKSAIFLAWRQRRREGKSMSAFRLRIGPLQIVHLPAEPFVEFQLHAQKIAKDSFVCVAGYGDCGIWYYGPDSLFMDKGDYEQDWALAGRCQNEVETTLSKLLLKRQLT